MSPTGSPSPGGTSAEIEIRPGRADDADAVDRVCRDTARDGAPQEGDAVDPALVSLVYALPYLALEPSTSRVLLHGGALTGYVVGALDSPTFYRRWTTAWAPRHLPRPEGADAGLVALLTDPMTALPAGIDSFPSHLHVNLLPRARGGGWGRHLLRSFLDGLTAAGSPGVHLRVASSNERATRFYTGLGFRRLAGVDTVTMVLQLGPARQGAG